MTTIPPIPGRRVIQIAAIPESDNHSYGVFALCDDGTIWEVFFVFAATPTPPHWEAWAQIPPLPGAIGDKNVFVSADLLAALKETAAIVEDQLEVITYSYTSRDGSTVDAEARPAVERFTKALTAARKAIDAAEPGGPHGR
jgi:hypothetical protein